MALKHLVRASCNNLCVKDEISKKGLFLSHPEIAREAEGWDPSEFTAGSDKKVLWRCSSNHLFESTIYQRTKRGDGCPYCSGRRPIIGETDLASTHPDLANEADGWDPANFSFGSQKLVGWRCRLNHYFEARIANRAINLSGCPFCSNNKVLAGFNDLLTTHPEFARQANGWDPSEFTSGSGSVKDWKCALGHEWKNTIHDHLKSKTGCPICANRRIQLGFNDLLTTHPEIAKEADGWDASKVSAGHDKKLGWVCSLGHKYKSPVYSRTGPRKSGCPYCSGRKVLSGFNDLASTHPNLATEAHGWDPKTVSIGHNSTKEWKCSLGHLWKISPMSRVMKGNKFSGCPICGGRKLLTGFNDIATKHPQVAEQAFGWDPTQVIGGHTKRKWKCELGHIWSADTISRINMGVGCPTCSKTGFDPNKDGYLYFLSHPHWNMQQIGITNTPQKRLKDHERLGWEVLEVRGPMDGLATQDLETSLLRFLRRSGAKLSSAEIAGKFDGYSEAWPIDSFQAVNLTQLISDLREFEIEND
jgi:hypothetical protein